MAKKRCSFILMLLMVSSLLGCGSGGYSDYSDYSDYEYDTSMGANSEETMDLNSSVEDSFVTNTNQTNRKLIKNASLYLETREFDELYLNIQKEISDLNGYIEKSSLYNGSSYYEYQELRSASLTIRIPNDKLEDFISDVKTISNVTNCEQSVEDVTLAYCDLESHMKALRTEQERLIELLDSAENVEDIITIESRLSQVRYEIESMESQLRTFDNLIDYSTVNMEINEVETLTPTIQKSSLVRIKEGFLESTDNVIYGIKEFLINFIIELPYLIMWLVIIIFIIFVLIKIAKRSMKTKKEINEQEDKNNGTKEN